MRREEKARIKELVQSGINYSEVAAALNAEGIKTLQGKDWTYQTVSQFSLRHLKIRKRRNPKVTRKKVKKAAEPKAKHSFNESLTMDILTSNMSSKNKLALIERLLK